MNVFETLIFFLAYFFFFGLISYKFILAAGHKGWEALLPLYNVYVMLGIIKRPWWWLILAVLPGVGNVMMLVILYELQHVFRLGTFKNIALTALTLGLYMAYLGWTEELNFQGRDLKEMRRHISELVASIIFAIVAASVIRAYTFEAFTIPTPSMEKSLMVGDFLFVSKLEYGVRVPMTPFALPLVHNRITFTDLNSYFDKPQLPYLRLPALSKVERNDPIVFNYPAEDIRPINMKGEVRPIDKREHYVKRAIGLPGDSLQLRESEVLIDGKPNELPDRSKPQQSFIVQPNGIDLSPRMLRKKLKINYQQAVKQTQMGRNDANRMQPDIYLMDVPLHRVQGLRAMSNVKRVEPFLHKPDRRNPVFPNPSHGDSLVFDWSRDQYGPLFIPAAGTTVPLNLKNYYTYQRVIQSYEGHNLERRGDEYLLDGTPVEEYTFEQDYYFAMGDNRHSSDDSRFWGFVPADHIVGKPVFIWMSYDRYADGFFDKIRYDRVFTTVSGNGERRSYFWPFVLVVGLLYVGNRFRKKRKKNSASKPQA